MPKLHLKETPEERADRKWRKAKKAERKARRKSQPRSPVHDEPSAKRRRTEGSWDEEGWTPPETSTKINPDQIRAEVEERMFREKLFDAMEDDYEHRLDGVEAHFNNYGHIPNRWKTTGANDRDLFDHPTVNPNEMLDEEYAEWVREGMWRRTHKAEMDERDRKKVERKARKEQERKAKEETARLERQREMERTLKREIKEKHRMREAWGYYETRWKAYNCGQTQGSTLKFKDIPWPVFSVPRTPEDLTSERISTFLMHEMDDQDPASTVTRKTRKERVREALLRWHPDKFEGKMGSRLDIHEKDMVMDGVGSVARCLNAMMA